MEESHGQYLDVRDGPGDVLPISVRAFAIRASRPTPPRDNPNTKVGVEQAAQPKRRYPRETLVFDTETAGDPAQPLNVGPYRVYRDRPDAKATRMCIEEGFFYGDDLPLRDPSGFAALQAYC